MKPNPRIAIVTKALVNKMGRKNNHPASQDLYTLIGNQAYNLGIQVQTVAARFFSYVDIFKLNELYDCNEKSTNIFDNYDLIIPVGGDGTFLSCAYFITNNQKVIYGINSDPKKSLGFLLELKLEQNFEQKLIRVFENIVNGNFELYHRKRFLVKSPKTRVLNEYMIENEEESSLIGLNDLFFSSYNQAQTTRYNFRCDLTWHENLRSTGCLIYTGSGSSAWAYGMNKIPSQSIEIILQYFNLPKDELAKIQKHVEEHYIFAPKIQKLAFKHREPTILNQGFVEQGYGKSFTIENFTHETFFAIDGFEYFLELGEKLEIELASVERDLLCLKIQENPTKTK